MARRHRDAAQPRNIGMVFQGYALFPHLSVADNVAYGLRMRKFRRRTRARARALSLVKLGEFASGGRSSSRAASSSASPSRAPSSSSRRAVARRAAVEPRREARGCASAGLLVRRASIFGPPGDVLPSSAVPVVGGLRAVFAPGCRARSCGPSAPRRAFAAASRGASACCASAARALSGAARRRRCVALLAFPACSSPSLRLRSLRFSALVCAARACALGARALSPCAVFAAASAPARCWLHPPHSFPAAFPSCRASVAGVGVVRASAVAAVRVARLRARSSRLARRPRPCALSRLRLRCAPAARSGGDHRGAYINRSWHHQDVCRVRTWHRPRWLDGI